MRPFSQMNEDYELDVTRAEACAMMRREFACVRTACCASGPAYLSSDAQSPECSHKLRAAPPSVAAARALTLRMPRQWTC